MTYRAYLRSFDGQVTGKTVTADAGAAAEAFAALVNRTDLDGQKRAAALTYNNRQLAFHRFDRKPGDLDYWRDRLDAIPWPPGHAGGTGAMEGGKPVLVLLDAGSLATAARLGHGNASEGIRKALAQAACLPAPELP